MLALKRKQKETGSMLQNRLKELGADYTSDIGSDAFSTDSEAGDIPDRRPKSFEFTDCASTMRLVRLAMTIQVIGLIIDDSAVHIPVLFRIACRGILFYSIRFYSRPFIDLSYILQQALEWILSNKYYIAFLEGRIRIGSVDTSAYSGQASGAISSGASGASEAGAQVPGGVTRRLLDAVGRMLGNSDYQDVTLEARPLAATLEFSNNSRTWHSIKYFSHFFLGPFFLVLSIILLLRVWEVKDYTDSKGLRVWLAKYILDGWWRRGSFSVAWTLIQGILSMAFVLVFLQLLTKQANNNSVPESRMLGTFLIIAAAVLCIIWLFAYYLLSNTESVFKKYVSQNVNYTSSMIFKKVIKTKVELAMLLMLLIFTPTLYNATQSIIFITDWNDTLAMPHRIDRNYYVPCYFMALPPFHMAHIEASTCSVADSYTENGKVDAFYQDYNIMQCDSYMGILFYTLGCVSFGFILIGCGYLFVRLITLSAYQFRTCPWAMNVVTLKAIQATDERNYNNHFLWLDRVQRDLQNEAQLQAEFLQQVPVFLASTMKSTAVGLAATIASPLLVVYTFVSFLVRRLCPREEERDDGGDIKIDDRKDDQSITSLKSDDNEYKENDSSKDAAILIEVSRINSSQSAGTSNSDNGIESKNIQKKTLSESLIATYRRVVNIDGLKGKYRSSILINGLRYTINRSLAALQSGNAKLNVISSMGEDKHADWRKQLTIKAKSSSILKLKKRIKNETARAKDEYVTDHILAITVLDRTIDTSGLAMLMFAFRWERLEFLIVTMSEMAMYAISAAIFNYFADWQSRLQYFIAINAFYGIITYILDPYVDYVDRWLDFWSRCLVIVFCVAAIYIYSIAPKEIVDKVPVALYEPMKSFSYITSLNILNMEFYLFIDILVVLAFYIYIIYILNLVGLFTYVRDKVGNIKYTLHDMVFDFLIQKLDTRILGVENMFTGLILIQQWDDIIRDQRRYALLTWPAVRPGYILSFWEKLIFVKWAAAFNLNIENMKNSLGLTVLHTTFCSAEVEVSRWIVYTYPQLLNEVDAQRDTPLILALKECAHYLLKYSKFNGGYLDDETLYNDESFSAYYKEIDAFRDAATYDGEYIKESGEVYHLTSREFNELRDTGIFTPVVSREEETPSFQNKIHHKEEVIKEEARKKIILAGGTIKEDDSDSVVARRAHKKKQQDIQSEKNSLFSKRFPEDERMENYEFGQLAAWNVISIEVPEVNLFIDLNDQDREGTLDIDGLLDADQNYAVHSSREIMNVDEEFAVPMDSEHAKKLKDWDIVRTGGPDSIITKTLSCCFGEKAVKAFFNPVEKLSEFESVRRSICYKMCRYSELLLTEEISSKMAGLQWDIETFKGLNKLSSMDQGRLAQNLALVCNLNPPPRFSRVSEWSLGICRNIYDDYPHSGDMDNITRVAVATLSFIGKAGNSVRHGVSTVTSVVSGALLNSLRKNNKQRGDPGYDDFSVSADNAKSLVTGVFTDRAIAYLADCFVCSRGRINLSDCELSVYGRVGWRAIARALRRKNSSFVLPSIFCGPKRNNITHLELSKNELDDGDAILIGEILLYQENLVFIDVSFNRIGARGMNRMFKLLCDHRNLATLNASHNRAGPGCSLNILKLFKATTSIKCFDMSYNRMGELVRYPTINCKEFMRSAARDIFMGLRENKTLVSLNLSYNSLGPTVADYLPLGLANHPEMKSLYIGGNSIGEDKGSKLIFHLSGEPGGEKRMAAKLQVFASLMLKAKEGENIMETLQKEKEDKKAADKALAEAKAKYLKPTSPQNGKRPKSGKAKNKSEADEGLEMIANLEKLMSKSELSAKAVNLTALDMSDNNLGVMSGYGFSEFVKKNKQLTFLDVSNNVLGFKGGLALLEGLEKIYKIPARDFYKQTMDAIEEKKYFGRNAIKRPLLYTSLTSLNMSQNHLGPEVASSAFLIVGSKYCTITNLDLSQNPIGYDIDKGGSTISAGNDLRYGFAHSKTLLSIHLENTCLTTMQTIPMLGGLAQSQSIISVNFSDIKMDEPSCLQLAHSINVCPNISEIKISNCSLGTKGGLLVLARIESSCGRITYVDISNNMLGPTSGIIIGKILQHPNCAIKTLNISSNDLMEVGGNFVAEGLNKNASLTSLDLSSNQLTKSTALLLVESARGIYKDGIKLTDCNITRYCISNNPAIGASGANALLYALSNGKFEHVEAANIGAGPKCASFIAKKVRDVSLTWKYFDISGNNLSRDGLNEMFWAIRQNRSIRVLLCGDNKAGPKFATDADTLLSHGIALARCLRANVILREIDLSFNGLSSEAGNVILDAMVDNYTIRRLSLRGNVFDDDISEMLSDLLRLNNLLDYLDIGDNRLGYNCCFSLAEGIEVNRSIKTLCVDLNSLGNAGGSTIDAFVRAMMMNCTLRVLHMDGNALGPTWGIALADVLARNNTLVNVSLKDNRLNSEAGRRLTNAYEKAPYLKELALSSDELSDDVWTRFLAVYCSKRSVAHVKEIDSESTANMIDDKMFDDYYD